MIPLRDNIPSRTVPIVNYAIIGLCLLTFLQQLAAPELTEQLAMIPSRVFGAGREVLIPDLELVRTVFGVEQRVTMRPVLDAAVPDWLTLLTCTFLHGGWLHLIGNVWFLWIFGDNVEDRLGHVGYAGFYLGCGVIASAAHLVSSPDSPVPTVGASGAIAGVMGAYFLLYPGALVVTLIPIVFFLHVVVIPAPIFLGIWFLLQLLQGSFAIGNAQAGGVAWWAHIGGFVAGVATVLLLRRRLRAPTSVRRPLAERPGHRRIHIVRRR